MCVLEQRATGHEQYSDAVPLQKIKKVLAVVHVLVVAGAGIVSGATSPAVWTALVALAVLPIGAMLVLWDDPSPTLSESITTARRP